MNPEAASSTPSTPGAATPPAVSRITTSSALRGKTGVAGGTRKGVLGAKKGGMKLGAKKVGAGEPIDFEAAEKKAKEEAERIAKLGYDPDAEDEKEKKKREEAGKAKAAEAAPVAARHTRNSSEVDKLAPQIARLGFGMTASTAPKPVEKKMGGFGSVGPISNGRKCNFRMVEVGMLTTSR